MFCTDSKESDLILHKRRKVWVPATLSAQRMCTHLSIAYNLPNELCVCVFSSLPQISYCTHIHIDILIGASSVWSVRTDLQLSINPSHSLIYNRQPIKQKKRKIKLIFSRWGWRRAETTYRWKIKLRKGMR